MIKTEETTKNIKSFEIVVKKGQENISYEQIKFIKKNENVYEYDAVDEIKPKFKDYLEELDYYRQKDKEAKSILLIMGNYYGPFRKIKWENSKLIIDIEGKKHYLNLGNGEMCPQ